MLYMLYFLFISTLQLYNATLLRGTSQHTDLLKIYLTPKVVIIVGGNYLCLTCLYFLSKQSIEIFAAYFV